ncbi:MAG: hypothetical protein ABIU84_13285, partial [Thermoanaerobaculia bacterium]
MSLISEALKKAEREAAARDARAKGQPPPFEAPLQPYRSANAGGHNRVLVPALALIGGTAVVAIGLLLFRPTGEGKASVKEKTAPGANARSNPVARPQSAPRPDPLMAPTTPLNPTPPSSATAAPATMPSASEPMAPPLAIPPLPKTALKPSPSPPSVSESAVAKPTGPPAAPAKAKSNGSGDYLRSVEFADG